MLKVRLVTDSSLNMLKTHISLMDKLTGHLAAKTMVKPMQTKIVINIPLRNTDNPLNTNQSLNIQLVSTANTIKTIISINSRIHISQIISINPKISINHLMDNQHNIQIISKIHTGNIPVIDLIENQLI
jgi:hypothetical protein